MDQVSIFESDSASRGLVLFWKTPVDIQVMDTQRNFIDVAVCHTHDVPWRFTGFYGEPKWEDKYKSWECLHSLNQSTNLPWVVIGDFNEILYSHEKEEGAPRPLRMMQSFHDALADCGLETWVLKMKNLLGTEIG